MRIKLSNMVLRRMGQGKPGDPWVKANRAEIDRIIKHEVGEVGRLTDDKRWWYVLNLKTLYLWAKREGITI